MIDVMMGASFPMHRSKQMSKQQLFYRRWPFARFNSVAIQGAKDYGAYSSIS